MTEYFFIVSLAEVGFEKEDFIFVFAHEKEQPFFKSPQKSPQSREQCRQLERGKDFSFTCICCKIRSQIFCRHWMGCRDVVGKCGPCGPLPSH